jgi:ribosomal protein S18 acetylase RimI-like enzyme
MAREGAVLIPMFRVAPGGLDAALGEATQAWTRRLHWDFAGTAELIRNYAAMQALEGLALLADGEVAGYCYWVHEAGKTLLGDLFVRERWRSAEAESALLAGVLAAVRNAREPARRVEAQLMQLGTRAAALLPAGPRPRAYPRLFMLRPEGAAPLPALRGMAGEWTFGPWAMRWREGAARLIRDVYSGHVDSEINDQYRTAEGAGRFVDNIVRYPGCGAFLPGASWLAWDEAGELAGLSLATKVAGKTGHIAQLCVRGRWRGSGLAHELVRRSIEGLRAVGAAEATLTVTEANARALALYERTGFHAIHRFEALVWS